MKKGIFKEDDVTKGFGLITSQDNEDYFVQVSGLRKYLKNKGLKSG